MIIANRRQNRRNPRQGIETCIFESLTAKGEKCQNRRNPRQGIETHTHNGLLCSGHKSQNRRNPRQGIETFSLAWERVCCPNWSE